MNAAPKPSVIVRIPTPIWTIVLIVIAFGADRLFDIPVLFYFLPVGIPLIVLGFALSLWGRLTFSGQGAEIFPWSEAHSTLVASGPFRFTRNPMYLGFVVLSIGVSLVEGRWMMWLVPIIVFTLDHFVIIPFEEASMGRAYGESYMAYKARVRRWL